MNLRKNSNIIRNDIFLNHENSMAVQCPKGESYTYGELLDYNKILFKHLKERSLVFSLSKNTIGSICGYLTFITNGVVPLMLDAELDQGFLNNLILTYKPEYIWLPSQRIHEFHNGKIIASFFDYSLLKLGSGVKVTLHNDLALLLTTSGSTGSPKLVKISYENIYSNAKSISSYLLINQAERPITTLPMYYSFGLSIINSHIINGATILLTNSSFMEKDFWSFIKSYKATSLSGIPYSFEMLKKLRFFNMELPYLKTITQAGGKLNDELNREFAEYCNNTGKRFFVMYGQTEASPRMGYLPHDHSISKLGSMGIAIPGGEFSLIDEKGNLIDQSDTLERTCLQREIMFQWVMLFVEQILLKVMKTTGFW